MNTAKIVIFSDVDGTLIDHDTYRFDAARDCLAILRRHRIPLVLASSKTSAEIIPLRSALGFSDCPAICENGAGLVEANSETPGAGKDYARLRAVLADLPETLRKKFCGFGDMTLPELIAATGLDPEAAERAKRREFSEPGLWTGSDAAREEFLDLIGGAGVRATKGGRFLTLSFGASKADRMAEILARYGIPPSIALGDAPNDIEMIAAADHGVIVRNPNHAPLPTMPGEAQGRIIRTGKTGPAGWSEAVMRILSKLDIIS